MPLLQQLTVRDFRNLEPLSWCPGAGSHLLLGGTGSGKSSLLEAVYVLTTTRSFRVSRLSDCVARGDEGTPRAGGFSLSGEVEDGARTRLEVGHSLSEGSWRRRNGHKSSLSEHFGCLPVLAWTAAESEILIGAPSHRRRFLDRGLLAREPALLGLLSRYRRILQHKREALLRRQRGVESWNELLAPVLAQLAARRQAYVAELGAALATVIAEAGLGQPAIGLRYRPSPEDAAEGTAAVAAALEGELGAEREAQRPLVGAHVDQLDIHWAGREVRRVASAGERKALGLLLIIAQSRALSSAGRAPLLLLDDADAELDQATLMRLWQVLRGAPQLLLASNRPGVWKGLEIDRCWRLERGVLRGLERAVPEP